MGAAGYVDEACKWAEKLALHESRGPGDFDAAMRRLAGRIGIPYSAFWRLRYKRPKVIAAHIYFALQGAFHEEFHSKQEQARDETIAELRGDLALVMDRMERLDRGLAVQTADEIRREIDHEGQQTAGEGGTDRKDQSQ